MKKLLLVVILCALLLPLACKKYEEGPCLSLRSAKNRIYGAHTLVKYTINGVDSLSSYYDSLGLLFNFVYNDINYKDVCIMNGRRKDGKVADFYWGWELKENNKILNITGADGSSNGFGIFKKNITPEWEILRLTNKEVKMKTNYNGKEYLIELEKK